MCVAMQFPIIFSINQLSFSSVTNWQKIVQMSSNVQNYVVYNDEKQKRENALIG